MVIKSVSQTNPRTINFPHKSSVPLSPFVFPLFLLLCLQPPPSSTSASFVPLYGDLVILRILRLELKGVNYRR